MKVQNTSSFISFKPPLQVARAAKKGLLLREKFARGGTAVGLARGKQLSNREPVSSREVLRMYSYFARHAVDKLGKDFFNPHKPSNGYIAWHLWGGDAGAAWVYAIRKTLGRFSKQVKMD